MNHLVFWWVFDMHSELQLTNRQTHHPASIGHKPPYIALLYIYCTGSLNHLLIMISSLLCMKPWFYGCLKYKYRHNSCCKNIHEDRGSSPMPCNAQQIGLGMGWYVQFGVLWCSLCFLQGSKLYLWYAIQGLLGASKTLSLTIMTNSPKGVASKTRKTSIWQEVIGVLFARSCHSQSNIKTGSVMTSCPHNPGDPRISAE